MRKMTVASGVGAGCLLMWASVACAEDAHMMDELVVTATRSESRAFDVPAPIATVSGQRLEETAPASVADALEGLPGVALEKAGSWEASPIIRGLGQNRVLVLYDGDRETNLWSGRSPLTPFMDMAAVDHIEVVKGPASALYGTDALGGVINIITRDVVLADGEAWRQESTITSRYSSTDEGWMGRYEMAAGGNGFGLLAGISGRNAGNYRDGQGDEVNNSQFENQAFDGKTRYDLNDHHRLTGAVRINNIDDMGVPQKDPASPWSHLDRFDTRSYKLGYEGKKIGVLDELKVSAFGVDQDRTYKGNYPNLQSGVYNLKENWIASSAIGSSIQARLFAGDHHDLIAGAEFVREDADSAETQSIYRDSTNILTRRLTFQPVPDAWRNHLGLFAQDEMTVGDRLTLIAGGRYDSFTARTENVSFTDERFNASGGMTSSSARTDAFEDADDGAGTFSLGLLYALSGHYHLTANAGSGFRAPDLFELYSVRGGGSQILLGNPDLNPEYAYNFDLGVKIHHARLKGGMNLFYNRVDDYIDTERQTQSFLSGIPTYRYVNVRNAELYGAEGEAQFFVLKTVSVLAGFSSVVGRDRDDNSNLHNIPPLNGTLGVRWEEEFGTLFRGWVELSGDFYDKNRNLGAGEEEEPGYGVANLRGGVRFPRLRMLRDVSLSVNVENLFDHYYFTHQRLEESWSAPESGINVVAALRFSF